MKKRYKQVSFAILTSISLLAFTGVGILAVSYSPRTLTQDEMFETIGAVETTPCLTQKCSSGGSCPVWEHNPNFLSLSCDLVDQPNSNFKSCIPSHENNKHGLEVTGMANHHCITSTNQEDTCEPPSGDATCGFNQTLECEEKDEPYWAYDENGNPYVVYVTTCEPVEIQDPVNPECIL